MASFAIDAPSGDPQALRAVPRDAAPLACAPATIELQLVDAAGDAVSPAAPVTVTLRASADAGSPAIVASSLVDAGGLPGATLTGRIPASGAATVAVTLDAAETLTLSWSSDALPAGATMVSFRRGPVDPAASSVTADGASLLAGNGALAITVVPRDACGLELGPDHHVTLATSHGTLGEVTDLGDGRYQASLTAHDCPADPAVITATADGVTLDEQPEITLGCAALDLASPVALAFSSDPLVVYDSAGQRVVDAVSSQATFHLLGSFGVWDRLELGFDLPFVVEQRGEPTPDGMPAVDQGGGLGDVRLVLKAQLVQRRLGGATLAAAASADLFLPTGDGASLRGDDLRIGPRLALDVTLDRGGRLGANLGYLHRSPRQFANLRIGDNLLWSLYGEVPLAGGVSPTAELFGRVGRDGEDDGLQAPIEAIAGGKLTSRRLFILAGAGVGVGRAYGTADWRLCLAAQLQLEKLGE